MRTLYTPIARCEVEHQMVRIDQPQRQCALEHGCPEGRVCPVDFCFVNVYEAYRRPGAWERSGGTCT